MAMHRLKTQQPWFEEVMMGSKTAELRLDDRGVQVGDVLHLCEWHPVTGYTERSVFVQVTHVLREFEGLRPGWAMYSFTKRVLPEGET